MEYLPAFDREPGAPRFLGYRDDPLLGHGDQVAVKWFTGRDSYKYTKYPITENSFVVRLSAGNNRRPHDAYEQRNDNKQQPENQLYGHSMHY